MVRKQVSGRVTTGTVLHALFKQHEQGGRKEAVVGGDLRIHRSSSTPKAYKYFCNACSYLQPRPPRKNGLPCLLVLIHYNVEIGE